MYAPIYSGKYIVILLLSLTKSLNLEELETNQPQSVGDIFLFALLATTNQKTNACRSHNCRILGTAPEPTLQILSSNTERIKQETQRCLCFVRVA